MNLKNSLQTTNLQDETFHAILNFIRSNQLKKGDRLPSQEDFSERLNISRATFREAMMRLTTLGIIQQIHGIGTFIAEDPNIVHTSMDADFSITEMIRSEGLEPGTSEVIASEMVMPWEAHNGSGEEVDTRVLYLQRVHTANGLPFAYTTAYLPLDIPHLEIDEKAFRGSLYVYLQEHCQEFVTAADTLIEAQVADESISLKLGVPLKSPILVLYQRHYNREGKLIIRSTDYFVQNRLKLRISRSRPGVS